MPSHAATPDGGALVAAVLERHGIQALFTLCGGHISPILVGCKARGLRVVDVRHEATAVFAADAAARLTGLPGVAAVTAGPGVTNAVTALKNAQLAQSPLVLLGGATATVLKGRGSLQDIDQHAVVRGLVKRFHRAERVRDVVPQLESALRECRAGVPGPVFVELPVDVLYSAEVVKSWYGAHTRRSSSESFSQRMQRLYLQRHARRLFTNVEAPPSAPPTPHRRHAPTATHRAAVAALLRRARRPVAVISSQALAGPQEAAALAAAVERLGVPVYLSGMARGLLGPRHPLQLRHRRREALREADFVLLAGTPCDFRLDYGRSIGRRAVLVSANLSAAELRLNRRPRIGVLAAPDLLIRALADEGPFDTAAWQPWLDSLHARDAEREAEIEAQASVPARDGIHPLQLCRAIDASLGDDSVLVADGGDFVGTAAYVVRPRRPLAWLDPGPFGTLGVGGGFAIGAAVSRPGAEVWILYGDGAAGYSLAEADTFVRQGLSVIAVIGNDASWAQIARDQVEILGDDVGTVLRRSDYHRVAEGFGATGFEIRSAVEAPEVLAAARAAARSGPVYVNAHLAPSEFRKGSLSM